MRYEFGNFCRVPYPDEIFRLRDRMTDLVKSPGTMVWACVAQKYRRAAATRRFSTEAYPSPKYLSASPTPKVSSAVRSISKPSGRTSTCGMKGPP